MTSQHLLRYLAAAVVINKRRRSAIKDVIRVIEQEAYEYSDPITQFLDALFVQYDFEGAQQKLLLCEQLIENDYFLTAIKEVCYPPSALVSGCVLPGWTVLASPLVCCKPLWCSLVHAASRAGSLWERLHSCNAVRTWDVVLQEFVESARLFIFETYCKIHQCIDMKMLASKLNMDDEAAEKWIVNLIRSARLNAKIDSNEGTVVMGMNFQSPYENVIDKAKGLSARTYMVANAVTGSARVLA